MVELADEDQRAAAFLGGADGEVLLRFPGPLSPGVVEKRIRPALAAGG